VAADGDPEQIASAEERFGAPLLYLLARYSLLHQYARAAATTPNGPRGVDIKDLIDRDIIIDFPGLVKPGRLPLELLGLAATPVIPVLGVTVQPLGQNIRDVAAGLAVHIEMGGSFVKPLLGGNAITPGLPRPMIRAVTGVVTGAVTGAATADARVAVRTSGSAAALAASSTAADAGTSEAAQVLAALDHLAPLPTETLDRLLRETLDLASHRLDAWVTSLATMRLSRMRA